MPRARCRCRTRLQISEYNRSQDRASLSGVPGRLLPALTTLVIGIFFMVLAVVLGGYGFTVDTVYDQVRPTAGPRTSAAHGARCMLPVAVW